MGLAAPRADSSQPEESHVNLKAYCVIFLFFSTKFNIIILNP
jgi:hypothetical protein